MACTTRPSTSSHIGRSTVSPNQELVALTPNALPNSLASWLFPKRLSFAPCAAAPSGERTACRAAKARIVSTNSRCVRGTPPNENGPARGGAGSSACL